MMTSKNKNKLYQNNGQNGFLLFTYFFYFCMSINNCSGLAHCSKQSPDLSLPFRSSTSQVRFVSSFFPFFYYNFFSLVRFQC
jgi:hypothetical protein